MKKDGQALNSPAGTVVKRFFIQCGTPLGADFCTIIGAGLFVGVIAALRLSQTDFLLRDEYYYLETAGKVLQHGTALDFTDIKLRGMPPGLIVLLAAAGKAGLPMPTAGMIFSLIAGMLCPWGCFLAAREIFKRESTARYAALLCATTPIVLSLSGTILRDVPYWCCVFFAIAFALQGVNRQKWQSWCGFALMACGAILFRKEGIEIWLPPVLFLSMSWLWQTDKKAAVVRNVRALLLIVMVSVAILLPVQYLMYHCGSAWESVPLRLGMQLYRQIQNRR